MHDFHQNTKTSGVCVPVSALRTKETAGWGEFECLVQLGQWTRKCGLQVVQILPINDTGGDPSPYMARSSLALNPVYTNVRDVLEFEGIEAARTTEYVQFVKDIKAAESPSYSFVLEKKLAFLRQFYTSHILEESPKLQAWIKKNAWIRPYAVFCVLKDTYNHVAWHTWPELENPNKASVKNFWTNNQKPCLFYAWLQYHLDRQLSAVVKKLDAMGVALKGDMPIMLDKESVDVWYHRSLFHLDRSAGAPPDQFSREGQLWGFPCHNWQAHQDDNFTWWKTRLASIDRYFKYVRLDHILGFFRIWTIPQEYLRGSFGYFAPSAAIQEQDLIDLGFNQEMQTWLTFPHIRLEQAKELFGPRFARVREYFDELDNGMLLRLKSALLADTAISGLDLSDTLKRNLLEVSHNRCLLKVGEDYHALWYYRDSLAYNGISSQDREKLEQLLERKRQENNSIWENQARLTLGILSSHTKAIICAEDVGAIPESLPRVLTDLKIMRLNVARWSRYWNEAGMPWMKPNQYPELSVATLSVHDSSTQREWWETENDDKPGFLDSLKLPRELANEPYNVELALAVVHTFLINANSRLVILSIQDYLSLCEQYREVDAAQERINIPGSVAPLNWHYKVKPPLEELLSDKRFIFLVKVVNTPF